jgi:hypothetical protein
VAALEAGHVPLFGNVATTYADAARARGIDPAAELNLTIAGDHPSEQYLMASSGLEALPLLGSACDERNGAHLAEDLAIVEVIDEVTGKPCGHGERGNLVVTVLEKDNFLVRYDLEDVVRLNTTPCSCGETHRRLFYEGRVRDVTMVSGKKMLPIDVALVLYEFPEVSTPSAEYQIVRPKTPAPALHVRCEHVPGRTRRRCRRGSPSGSSRRTASRRRSSSSRRASFRGSPTRPRASSTRAEAYRLCAWAAAISAATFPPPSMRWSDATSGWLIPATSAPNACSNAATVISAGSSRTARTTARPTSSGERVPAPRGSVTFVSANMPASRMKPGKIVVTPTPVPWRSSRRPEREPAQAELRRRVDARPGAATLPEIDEMRTIWPRPRSRMPIAARRAITIGARRFTSSARSISSTLKSRSGPLDGSAAFATSTSIGPASSRQRSTLSAIGQVRDDGLGAELGRERRHRRPRAAPRGRGGRPRRAARGRSRGRARRSHR